MSDSTITWCGYPVQWQGDLLRGGRLPRSAYVLVRDPFSDSVFASFERYDGVTWWQTTRHDRYNGERPPEHPDDVAFYDHIHDPLPYD